MHDLLIIGGGPSGVAAAAYAQHLGLDALIISPDLGGKVNYRFSLKGLENVDTVHGASLVRTFAAALNPRAHIAQQAKQVKHSADGFAITTNEGEHYEGRALIIATGAKPRRLHVPGEQRYWGKGLSYSAVSHAPLFVGRQVAVVGNDRRAQIAALELARAAHTVFLVAPQPKELDPVLMERLQERGNAHLFRGWEVISVDGDDFVRALSLQNTGGVIRRIEVDGVFVELGLLPNSQLVAHLVERDGGGYIAVDRNAVSSQPGLFAAGDISNVHGEQVPVALGEGIKAALSASEYLATLAARVAAL